MRTALVAVTAAAALFGLIRAAEACSPPPEGWQLETIAPADGRTLAPDDPILLRGMTFFPLDEAALRDSFAVEVIDGDGALVPGSLTPAPGRDDFFWTADAPLTPGAAYEVRVYEIYPWDDERYLSWTRTVQVGERTLAESDGALSIDAVRLFEREILGDCFEEELCGGCFEAEVLGHETHWRVELSLDVPEGSYDAARSMRVAIGADADEARRILARTRPGDLNGAGDVHRRVAVGARALWPSDRACAAVEVHDPVEGVVFEGVQCFDVPAADGPIEPDRPDGPLVAGGVDPGPGSGDAGCDASGAGGAGGLWALVVLAGLGRRRRGLWAAIAAALLAAGCAPDDSGSTGQPCGDDCAPVDPVTPAPFDLAATPPVFGGSMAATDTHAVIGDADRDAVYVVDLADRSRVAVPSRRPGRVALDAAGATAYVSLRDAGQIQVIDVDTATERARFEVCPAPRGVALDAGRLHVACAGGALLTLDAATGRVERRVELAPDLRDVVVDGDALHVSRFKQPTLWTLGPDGAVLARRSPRTDDALTDAAPGAPTVAWRTLALPGGGALMLHQRSRLDTVRTETPGGYGDPAGERTCGDSIVTPEVTAFPPLGHPTGDAPRTVVALDSGVVVVDMTLAADRLVLAAAGQGRWSLGEVPADLADPDSWGRCATPREIGHETSPQYTAVAAVTGGWLAYAREPGHLRLPDADTVTLSQVSVAHEGHGLFHADAGRGIACASCHPEGGEDGHAWLFEGHGLRRTQELRGGIAGSAPFHWVGDMRDIRHLMDEVLTRRMGGPEVTDEQADAVLAWLDAQPLDPTAPIGGGDPVAGALVFEDAVVGCAACHSGPRLTDDQRYDVGTGGLFSTPTLLGVARRGAMMHDGCGLDLRDRFDPACGGGDAHGRTSHLSATQLDDLIAYLGSL